MNNGTNNYLDADVGQLIAVPPGISIAGQNQLDGDVLLASCDEVGDGDDGEIFHRAVAVLLLSIVAPAARKLDLAT